MSVAETENRHYQMTTAMRGSQEMNHRNPLEIRPQTKTESGMRTKQKKNGQNIWTNNQYILNFDRNEKYK